MSAIKPSKISDTVLQSAATVDSTPTTAHKTFGFDLSGIDRDYKKGPFYATESPAKAHKDMAAKILSPDEISHKF